jgi:hypothetical protein
MEFKMLSFSVIFINVLDAFIDMKTDRKCVREELKPRSTSPDFKMAV